MIGQSLPPEDRNERSGILPDGMIGGIVSEGQVEVEIEPLDVEVEDPDAPVIDYSLAAHGDNLAEYLTNEERRKLARCLDELFREDKESRSEWERTAAQGYDLLGLEVKPHRKGPDAPFDGASSVIDPVITEAIIRFQSSAIQEIFPGDGPVDIQIRGKVNDAVRYRALRKKEYMNHVLTTEMDDYREETEKLLWDLAFQGAAFRKIYPDPQTGEPEAKYYPAHRVIIPYGCPSLWKAPRYSCEVELDDTELRRLQISNFYRDVKLQQSTTLDTSEVQDKRDEVTKESKPIASSSTSRTLIEMYVKLNLDHFDDEDGIASPYIVTYDQASLEILSIRRNWREGDQFKKPTHWMVQYTFIPGPGSYGFGYVHLIGNLAKSSTVLLRLLLDSGVLSTLMSGLVTGLRTKDGEIRLKPGTFQNADVASQRLAESLMVLPYKEPSQVLMALRGEIKADARSLASIADPEISGNGDVPVGTILAVLENKLKILSAIQARLHRSLKKEFEILDRCIRQQLSDKVEAVGEAEYEYDVEGGSRTVKLSDFMDSLVCRPVSDPNMATQSAQVMKQQFALNLSATAPQIYNLPVLHREALRTLGLKSVDEIIPDKSHIPVMDPNAEIAAIMTGKPIKTFPWQNHEAHLTVLMNFINNPMLKQQLSQMPQGQSIMAAAMAAVTERIGYIERQKVEKALGFPLPPLGEPIAPEVEIQLSGAIARASTKALQGDIAQSQAQQRQAEAEDPMIQSQKKQDEIAAFKAQKDFEAKITKIQADSTKAAEREATERMRIQADTDKNNRKLQTELLWVQNELNKADEQEGLSKAQINELKARTAKIMAEIASMQEQPRMPEGSIQ